ncbi:hypothetical protein [Limobrevibacterium gyesilva]|uniref:DUF2269 family protein n=1 Tax=Limobrevibacterium gyesilva TaxID=2991712 RepID=A0AA41YJJ5_9PROT|nr:hypothetical protein [Limobrevibacterium gyesilva]MCW3473745.1 hypothetical protein [Limobrevibacterium gyesilva]
MQQSATVALDDDVTPIAYTNLIWVGVALAVMVAVIRADIPWALNFLHVICGILWTGIDLFMGFVLGPIMRRLPLPARRAVICRLMPRMLFLMPTLSIITGTAGYYHAQQMGFLDVGYPAFWWVVAALVIVTILTVQGLGLLLPTNLLVYLEMRKDRPDGARIGRLMRRYVRAVGFQGVLQVTIIVVMARFATGL